jgi:hypothetical protein
VEVEVEKLFAERERGVLKERAGMVLCGRTRQGREKSKTSGQSILALSWSRETRRPSELVTCNSGGPALGRLSF